MKLHVMHYAQEEHNNAMDRSRGAVRPYESLLREHLMPQLPDNEVNEEPRLLLHARQPHTPRRIQQLALHVPPSKPARNPLLSGLSVSFALPKSVSAPTVVTGPLSPMSPAFCDLPLPPLSAPQRSLLPTLPGRTGGSWAGRMGAACGARRSSTVVEVTR